MPQNDLSQHEKLPVLNLSAYRQSDAQKNLVTDICSIAEGAIAELDFGAMDVFSGKSPICSYFQQQALYVANAVMGCVTQDYINAFPCHWFICVGESGSRKTVANQIIKNTISSLRNKCFTINMPASREGLYTRLGSEYGSVPKPNVLIEFDEGLSKLSKLWANQRPETSGPLNALMETLLGAFGAPVELGEITNKDPAKSSKSIPFPRIALSLNGQGVSFSKCLASDTFLDNGFYHRCLVFDFVGKDSSENLDDYLSDAYTSDLIIDSSHLKHINNLFKPELCLSTSSSIPFVSRGRPPSSQYDFRKDYEELIGYLHQVGAIAHARAITDQFNNRMRERVRTLAWIHAFGRRAKKWESVDVTYAMMMAGLHYQNILNRIKNAPLESRTDYQLMKYILANIQRKKFIKRYYIFNLCAGNSAYSSFDHRQISAVLRELESEGLIRSKKVGKTTVYELGGERVDNV